MDNMPFVYQVEYGEKEQVVTVLTAAFNNYPVMRYVLEPGEPGYAQRLNAMVGFFCEVRFLKGWPVLGVRDGDNLVAAALANSPVNPPGPPQVQQAFKNLRQDIGSAAIERLTAYEDACEGLEPDAPHYYLGMVGVLPGQQGKGYARLLLDYLHETADNDPAATGACLNTESAGNLPIYRHLGYEVIGEVDVGPLHTWCMFRPSRIS